MSSQFHESVKRIQNDTINATQNWRTVRFWQEIFLYFFVFSIIGHYIESIWGCVKLFINGGYLWHPSRITIIPSGPPYGFGVVAMILLVVPLIKKYKLSPLAVFIVNIFITGAIELVCGLILESLGGGRYWNYTTLPLNVAGYVWIGSAASFSLIATPFIYYIYPFCQKSLAKLYQKENRFNTVFWIAFIFYIFELLAIYLKGGIY